MVHAHRPDIGRAIDVIVIKITSTHFGRFAAFAHYSPAAPSGCGPVGIGSDVLLGGGVEDGAGVGCVVADGACVVGSTAGDWLGCSVGVAWVSGVRWDGAGARGFGAGRSRRVGLGGCGGPSTRLTVVPPLPPDNG